MLKQSSVVLHILHGWQSHSQILQAADLPVVDMRVRHVNMQSKLHTGERYERYFKRRIAAIVSAYCERELNECWKTQLRLTPVSSLSVFPTCLFLPYPFLLCFPCVLLFWFSFLKNACCCRYTECDCKCARERISSRFGFSFPTFLSLIPLAALLEITFPLHAAIHRSLLRIIQLFARKCFRMQVESSFAVESEKRFLSESSFFYTQMNFMLNECE